MGQLATYAQNSVGMPKVIDMPECLAINHTPDYMKAKQEHIVQVKCGFRYSAIVSSKGNLWMCGNYRQEKIQRFD